MEYVGYAWEFVAITLIVWGLWVTIFEARNGSDDDGA